MKSQWDTSKYVERVENVTQLRLIYVTYLLMLNVPTCAID